MKKLSALIALLLCVTVGGVYATWTYVSDSADVYDASKEILVELEDATTTGAAGTFTITSNLALKIDQKEYAEGEVNRHEAVLKYYSTDSQPLHLTVVFTPSVNASEDVHNNAVPAELYFTTTTDMNYPADETGKHNETGEYKDIFVFSNKADGKFAGKPGTPDFDEEKDIDWVKQDDGTFKVIYDAATLEQMIKLNTEETPIILDTKDDYDHFVADHLTGNISVHVTDGTVQTGGTTGDQG